jgi:hypothetical protein
VDWINLAEDKIQWLASVNIPYNWGFSLRGEHLPSFQGIRII